jgi:NADPH-dependent 2,4-dienoyl-CoA reductase/sulfur reductase-like enzyme
LKVFVWVKKILIVGGVAGGASAAARLRRLGEDNKIIMFERGTMIRYKYYTGNYMIMELI